MNPCLLLQWLCLCGLIVSSIALLALVAIVWVFGSAILLAVLCSKGTPVEQAELEDGEATENIYQEQ